MKGIYDSAQVANFFLKKAEKEDVPISMLKLVKLCYVAHGFYLGLTGKPLIREEVQAWQYGPVIPSLYHEFKSFGRRSIDRFASVFVFSKLEVVYPKISKDNKEDRAILSKVWDSYKDCSGEILINKTHAKGTPWYKVYKDGVKGIVIPDESIEAHYKGIISEITA